MNGYQLSVISERPGRSRRGGCGRNSYVATATDIARGQFWIALLAAIALILGVSACTPGTTPIAAVQDSSTPAATPLPLTPTPTIPASDTPQPPTQPAAHTPTSILTAAPSPSATASPLACWATGGRIETGQLTTSLLNAPLDYRVYLPPCYDEQPGAYYPVLYLIHGQSFTDDQWDRLGADTTADTLIASGEVAPFLIVMPRDRVWTEPTKDRFGEAVVGMLLPWVDSQYRTIPDRQYRAVGGLSRGGGWAVHFGLAYWELFGAFGAHSGFVFNTDVPNVKTWLADIPAGQMPRIYLDIGDNDHPDIAESAVWLEKLLAQKDIPHEWHMFHGYHEEAYWQAHVEDYLRWYAAEW